MRRPARVRSARSPSKMATPSSAPKRCAYQMHVWHHSQEVRQGSAKSSPPVQVWVMPPKRTAKIAVLFYSNFVSDLFLSLAKRIGKIGQFFCATKARTYLFCPLRFAPSNARVSSAPSTDTMLPSSPLSKMSSASWKAIPIFVAYSPIFLFAQSLPPHKSLPRRTHRLSKRRFLRIHFKEVVRGFASLQIVCLSKSHTL